jgi:hypothetical protein
MDVTELLDRTLYDEIQRTTFDALVLPGLLKAEIRAEPALRVTDRVLDTVAERSVHFSFAYLKELTLASTMAFIADPRPGAMDEILARTFEVLRSEMDSTNVVLPPRPSGRLIGVRLEPGE